MGFGLIGGVGGWIGGEDAVAVMVAEALASHGRKKKEKKKKKKKRNRLDDVGNDDDDVLIKMMVMMRLGF
jgi:hypothetical protein